MTRESDDQVEFFGKWMTREWADALQAWQGISHYVSEGKPFQRIPYASETFRQPLEARQGPCRHCSTILGKLHEPRCDYEQCPVCNGQAMSCDCEYAED